MKKVSVLSKNKIKAVQIFSKQRSIFACVTSPFILLEIENNTIQVNMWNAMESRNQRDKKEQC